MFSSTPLLLVLSPPCTTVSTDVCSLVLDALDLGLQDTGLLLDHLLGFVAAWHVVCVGIVFSNTDLNAVRLKLTQQLSRIMTIESHR